MQSLRSARSLFSISLFDLWQEVIVKEGIGVVIRFPVPFSACQRIIYIFRPGIHDSLAARVWLKTDLRTGKCLQRPVAEFARCERERGDVIDRMMEVFARHIYQHQQRL